MKRPLITYLLFTSFIVEVVAKDRPNVLFIMSDDHTAQAVGAYATVLKSLTRLQLWIGWRQRMVFDNVFCSIPFVRKPRKYQLGNTTRERSDRSGRARSSREAISANPFPQSRIPDSYDREVAPQGGAKF